jgi:hypothetical protein
MSTRNLFLLLIAFLSACAPATRLPREQEWAYFEDWDIDNDLKLDAQEFTRGYAESRWFRTWAGRAKSIKNSELTEKLAGATNDMKMSIALSVGQDTVASTKSEAPNSQEALPAFVDRTDDNDDGTVTNQEWARAMYMLADENYDLSISPLEFYRWQLLRG